MDQILKICVLHIQLVSFVTSNRGTDSSYSGIGGSGESFSIVPLLLSYFHGSNVMCSLGAWLLDTYVWVGYSDRGPWNRIVWETCITVSKDYMIHWQSYLFIMWNFQKCMETVNCCDKILEELFAKHWERNLHFFPNHL